MSDSSGFWSDGCPERGNGTLSHAHWRDCDPQSGGHPGTLERHEWNQCCHCEHTPATWAREQKAAAAPPLADPDSMPLALEQVSACGVRHEAVVALSPLIGEAGLEWAVCPACGVPLEPKLATGKLNGPPYGRGRGWVTLRMKKRWDAVSFRMAGRH